MQDHHPHQHASLYTVSYTLPGGEHGIHARCENEEEAKEAAKKCRAWFNEKAKVKVIDPVKLPKDEWNEADPFEGVESDEAMEAATAPGKAKA